MIYREIKLNAKEHSRFVSLMKKKCADRGITLEQLATEIEVAPKSLYNFIADTTRNPSRFTAAKIANHLEIKKVDYKSKGSFFIFPLLLAIPILLKGDTTKAEPTTHNIDKEQRYIEVFGDDPNTDFVPGFYPDINMVYDVPLDEELQIYIQGLCREKDIAYSLVLAIIEQESAYKADATNGSCKGLMQINTAVHKITDAYNPYENVNVGIDLLHRLFVEYEDYSLVLDLYNGNKKAFSNYEKGKVSAYAQAVSDKQLALERRYYGGIY